MKPQRFVAHFNAFQININMKKNPFFFFLLKDISVQDMIAVWN